MFIDSHAHLTCADIVDANDIEGIVSRAAGAGVEAIINPCTDESSLKNGIALHERYSWIYNAAATTPHDVEQEGEAFFPLVEEHARSGRLVAIGETGLDYHYTHSHPKIQRDFFRKYLLLAKKYNLPVIIHCREAFDDMFSILDSEYAGHPAVVHCFTGTIAEASKAIDRGLYISLGGIITFTKSIDLRKVVEMVPLNRILIETDTPYLAPQRHRGERNEPSFIAEVVDTIAMVKNIPRETIARETAENARRLFLNH